MVPCFKAFCLVLGSPKTYFVFTLNSIFHMFSRVFDPLNLTSQLMFVKHPLAPIYKSNPPELVEQHLALYLEVLLLDGGHIGVSLA